jgi:hypothetical protein
MFDCGSTIKHYRGNREHCKCLVQIWSSFSRRLAKTLMKQNVIEKHDLYQKRYLKMSSKGVAIRGKKSSWFSEIIHDI